MSKETAHFWKVIFNNGEVIFETKVKAKEFRDVAMHLSSIIKPIRIEKFSIKRDFIILRILKSIFSKKK